MKRRTKVLTVAALAAAFLVAGVLPYALIALPNPPEYQEVDVASERGAYATDGTRLIRLYPHPQPADGFPEGVATVGPDAELQVHSRQYDDLSRYRLVEHDSQQQVTLRARLDADRVLHLSPQEALDPGRYAFESVQDSMYGEPEFYYFEVVGGTAGAGGQGRDPGRDSTRT